MGPAALPSGSSVCCIEVSDVQVDYLAIGIPINPFEKITRFGVAVQGATHAGYC
jgi:hypothetical protein